MVTDCVRKLPKCVNVLQRQWASRSTISTTLTLADPFTSRYGWHAAGGRGHDPSLLP